MSKHETKKEKRYDNIYQIVIAVLATLLIVSIASGGFRFGSVDTDTGGSNDDTAPTGNTVPSAPSGNNGGSGGNVDMQALMDDDAIKGDPNAPVTIVEWSDYECPFCQRFYSQTLSQIESQYIDTGKVKLVYRDFPLSIHPQAQKAEEAAECAGEQGKYYEMHDMLFDRGVSGGVSSFKNYAEQLGLDTAAFNSCLDSGEMAAEVKADMQAGASQGIRGTPGFIINGQLVSGAQPFQVFEQIIEEELAK